MNVAITKNGLTLATSQAFDAVAQRLPGGPRVAELRRNAFAQFERQGLPNRRIEDWKYTDLRAMLREAAPLAAAPDDAALARAAALLKARALDGARALVLVDGVFAAGLSDLTALEPGLAIRTLRDALEAGDDVTLFDATPADAMAAYGAALATDGFVISIADGTSLTRPICILHITTASNAAVATRSMLTLGATSTATLVEVFAAAEGAGAYQLHDHLTIAIGDNSKLEHVRLIEDAPDAVNLAGAQITVGASARYNVFGLATSALISRYQPTIVFNGEHSHVSANGVNMLGGKQHADTTLILDHAVPNCVSRETFRAVLDGRAHSVFQGRIVVRPLAQKTDAKMMTRALLLSDEAEADNKPELEIFADDVTCGHGATAGALDDSLLFYLRARGLSEKQAQALLIQAFVGEAIESIADETLREAVIAVAERWLEARA